MQGTWKKLTAGAVTVGAVLILTGGTAGTAGGTELALPNDHPVPSIPDVPSVDDLPDVDDLPSLKELLEHYI